MTTTYRTPEWLGNTQVRIVTRVSGDNGQTNSVTVVPVDGPDDAELTIHPRYLTEVKPLPWKNHGVEVQQTMTDSGPGDHVHVSTKAASHGFAHLKPSVAREMARALWTAADQAEAAQS